MILYREEKFKDVLPEFDKLLTAHMAEMNYFGLNGAKFDPDYDKYVRGQELGYFVLITARDNGVLVGYTVFGVQTHIRYKSTVYAQEDLYYVCPEYRRQGIAKQLFVEVEKVLKTRKVEFIFATTKTYHNRSGLLEQSGYKQFELKFAKKIEE